MFSRENIDPEHIGNVLSRRAACAPGLALNEMEGTATDSGAGVVEPVFVDPAE